MFYTIFYPMDNAFFYSGL